MLKRQFLLCLLLVVTSSSASLAQSSPPEMVDVPAGWFEMGARPDEGGAASEGPRHYVYLSPYKLARFEVTNGEFAEILNWALDRGYLTNSAGLPYVGGDVYTAGNIMLGVTTYGCQIYFSSGQFLTKIRGAYSMDNHPVTNVSWWGAIAYCNFLSEKNAIEPCYELATGELLQPVPEGYRLPTEAEFERAMSWDSRLDWVALPDGTTGGHWIFGFGADAISPARANYGFINPLRLPGYPYSVPVGYYDGISTGTLDGPSPVGCYDLSGNVQEWTWDRFSPTWYTTDDQYDPTGPSQGNDRTIRGGTYFEYVPGWNACRGAARKHADESVTHPSTGFRVAQGAMGVVNSPPLADAGDDAVVEATRPEGATVLLDASGSSDADSTPGTNDDIVSFQWFAGGVQVADGQLAEIILPLGAHVVTLVVTDSANETSQDDVLITVQDTTPPVLSVQVSPDLLWPPNRKLVQVTPIIAVTDACDPAPLVSLSYIVAVDHAQTATFIADGGMVAPEFLSGDVVFAGDGGIFVRAERSGKRGGRTYTLTFQASDASGNIAEAFATVIVPVKP